MRRLAPAVVAVVLAACAPTPPALDCGSAPADETCRAVLAAAERAAPDAVRLEVHSFDARPEDDGSALWIVSATLADGGTKSLVCTIRQGRVRPCGELVLQGPAAG